jgi:hypothetical protein
MKVIPTKVRNRKASECVFEKVHVITETNLMASGCEPDVACLSAGVQIGVVMGVFHELSCGCQCQARKVFPC